MNDVLSRQNTISRLMCVRILRIHIHMSCLDNTSFMTVSMSEAFVMGTVPLHRVCLTGFEGRSKCSHSFLIQSDLCVVNLNYPGPLDSSPGVQGRHRVWSMRIGFVIPRSFNWAGPGYLKRCS